MYFNAISIYRIGAGFHRLGVPIIPRLFDLSTYIICNCSIPASAEIGKGTVCGHRGIGVVINPESIIGENCIIRAHVVIGGIKGELGGAPRIGNNVEFGVGAKVLGNITIGDNAVIGANAVVLSDVPAGAVAVGVPARILNASRRSGEKSSDKEK